MSEMKYEDAGFVFEDVYETLDVEMDISQSEMENGLTTSGMTDMNLLHG